MRSKKIRAGLDIKQFFLRKSNSFVNYFIPYFKGKGIRDLYEITGIRTITAKEAKQSDDESDKDDIRLAFKLRFIRKLFDDYKKIDTSKMKKDTFIDTTFDGIETV